MKNENIVLIGMPGAGKSTIGVLLAKEIGAAFVDTDILIQTREEKTLQTILEESDYLNLRAIEESLLLSLSDHGQVIATGGSAVYSNQGMIHLKHNAIVVFLEVSLTTLIQRIDNYDTRGIARRPDQSFDELFQEREKLYNHYADIHIISDGLSTQETVRKIISAL